MYILIHAAFVASLALDMFTVPVPVEMVVLLTLVSPVVLGTPPVSPVANTPLNPRVPDPETFPVTITPPLPALLYL